MKKILAILLGSIIMLSSLVGCGGDNTGGGEIPPQPATDYKVWTIDVNEKILQDKPDLYTKHHGNNKIDVFAAKNEKECGQFTITALEGSVLNYTIELSDLKSATGNTFSKDNIDLYNQKYFNVAQGDDHYFESGLYPDAILPFDTAVEYGENTVKEGNNQSITVRFDVPENQPADIYTGSIKVVVDGKDHNIPVSLKVYDTTVSEEVHTRSSFAVAWQMEEGEFDTSIEKRMTYINFLAEYMVSGANPFVEFFEIDLYSPESIKVWVDCYKELYKNPKISTIRFPKVTVYDNYNMDGTEYQNVQIINSKVVYPIMEYLMDACVEDKVDYMTKAFFRGMDEPQINGTLNGMEIFHHSYLQLVKYGKDYIDKKKNGSNNAFIEQVKASLDKIPIVTTYGKIQDFEMSYCPYYNEFQSASDRQEYLENTYNELWWYGCNVPDAPYPTYHVDDSLLSARIASWMQYDYNIIGNLYWAVDAWESYGSGYDFYDIKTTYEDGEGVLVYPGKPYGLEVPVASVRLEAIRDGLEEYELLRSLELAYKAINSSYDIDDLLALMSESIYSNAQVIRDIEAFNASRKTLYELSELANTAGFMIPDIDIVDGKYTVTIFAKDGCTIKSHGKTLEPTATNNSGKIYVDTFTIGGDIQGLDYEVTCGGKTYSLSWHLSSSSTSYTATDLKDMVKSDKYSAPVITSVVDASNLGLTGTDKYLQIGVSEIKDNSWQKLILNHSIFANMGEKTKSLVLYVYYDAEKDTDEQYFKLSFKYSSSTYNGGVAVPKVEMMLKKGLNMIEIENVYNTNWKVTGAIKHIEISYADNATPRPAVSNVYIKNVTIFDR